MARTWGQGRKLPKSSPVGDQNKFLKEDPTAPDGVAWVAGDGIGDLLAENNLSDVDDVAEARDNLGLGTVAVEDTGYETGEIPVVSGGTPDGTLFLRDDGVWAESGGGADARTFTVVAAGSLPANPPTGLAGTYDDVTLVDGDQVLIKSSSNPNSAFRGVWVAHVGAWTRPAGFETGDNVCGVIVYVAGGTADKGKEFVIRQRSSDAAVAIVGTDGLSANEISAPNTARFRSEQFIGDGGTSYVSTIDNVAAGQGIVQVYTDTGSGFILLDVSDVAVKINGAITLTFSSPTVGAQPYRLNIVDNLFPDIQ